jgi:hypothetical protein
MGRQVIELINIDDLPVNFGYPREYVRVLELGITDLEPWVFLGGEELRATYAGLRERYSDQSYVPFASRQDNDDIACWAHVPPEVVVVHDHASPGWERRGRPPLPNFHSWFRIAVEDFIQWGEIELGL